MFLALAAASLGIAACVSDGRPHVILATTTSVANSGLLDRLLSEFEREAHVQVRPLLAGSGRAIAMLARGEADLVISHAPRAEADALASHPRWFYRKIMYGDFVIVGPDEDPARVRAAPTAAAAMAAIARAGVKFISRGDESGTHERERELWAACGVQPCETCVVRAGAAMGDTLRVAGEAMAYTLTDRATFEQLAARVRLRVLLEGDPALLNTYAVLLDPTRRSPAVDHARRFASWLAEGRGRELIARYRVGHDVQAFHIWPAGAKSDSPESLPPR